VEFDGARQVEIRKDVTADDDERFPEETRSVADTAGGPIISFCFDILQADPELRAVSKVVRDQLGCYVIGEGE